MQTLKQHDMASNDALTPSLQEVPISGSSHSEGESPAVRFLGYFLTLNLA